MNNSEPVLPKKGNLSGNLVITNFRGFCGNLWVAHLLRYINNFPMEFDSSKDCFGIVNARAKDHQKGSYNVFCALVVMLKKC